MVGTSLKTIVYCEHGKFKIALMVKTLNFSLIYFTLTAPSSVFAMLQKKKNLLATPELPEKTTPFLKPSFL